MALVATLSDAELQLSRVTGVVRLHARLTEASLESEDVWESIGNKGDVLALVGNVERAQSELHGSTQQLLGLIKRSLNGDLVGTEVGNVDDSETEDELEHCGLEPPISIKLEDTEYNAETLDESTGVTTQMNQDTDRDVEPKKELVDDMGFNALTNCGGKANEMARKNIGDGETKKIIVDADERGIVSWKQAVENNAIDAERGLLEQFGFGDVEGGNAATIEKMEGVSTAHIDSVSGKGDGLFVQSNLYFPPIKTKRSRRTRRSGKRKRTTSVDTNHSAGTEDGMLDRVSAVSEASVATGCVKNESKSSGGSVTLASDRDSSHKEGDGQFLEVTPEMKPLQLFLDAAKETKQSIEAMILQQDTNATSPAVVDLVLVKKWNLAVKHHFARANKLICSLLVSRTMNENVATAFSEATVLAVSLMTTADSNGIFRRSWILQAMTLLDNVHVQVKKSSFAQVLVSVFQSRNALLEHCEKCFPDVLDDTMGFVCMVEETEAEEVDVKRLQSIISTLSHKITRDSAYCILRHQVDNIKPWTEVQWHKFSKAALIMSNWMQLAVASNLPPPNLFKGMLDALANIEHKFPGRAPKTLFDFCGRQSSQLTGTYDSTPASMESSSSGLDAMRTGRVPDTGNCSDISKLLATKIKRVKTSDDFPADCRPDIKAYYEMTIQLAQRLEAGEEIVSFSHEASDIRQLFGKAHQVNRVFMMAREDVHPDTQQLFGEATAILTDLICRCPSESVGYYFLKGHLRQYAHILPISATHFAHLVETLRASYGKLEDYWEKYFADPVQAMRKHVETTEKHLVDLDPQKLKYPMRQLQCQFRDACEVRIQTPGCGASPIQTQQHCEDFMKIGLALSRWITRILEGGGRLPRLRGLPTFLSKLIEVEAISAGSIPPSLVESVRQLIDGCKKHSITKASGGLASPCKGT